jgi:ketosteroid isomerase-like protein
VPSSARANASTALPPASFVCTKIIVLVSSRRWLSLGSCAGAAARYSQPVSEATRALIDAYNDAWNEQDLDRVCSFHHDAIVFENHSAGERAEGADAVRAHIGGIFERWPSLRFRGRALYAADGFAVSEWTATAVRADGAAIEWDGVDVFPLETGKILRKDVYSTSHAPRVSGTSA